MTRSVEKVHMGFALPKELETSFRVLCAKNGMKVSQRLRNLIECDVNNVDQKRTNKKIHHIIEQLEEVRDDMKVG